MSKQIMWTFRFRDDDIASLDIILATGFVNRVYIGLLHRDDMTITKYSDHEYKVPLAIAKCAEYGVKVVFMRNLWPSWILDRYETGGAVEWSSGSPNHVLDDIVIHNKDFDSTKRKVYYECVVSNTTEEPGTGTDWEVLSSKDFEAGIWYDSSYYEAEIQALKTDVAEGGIAEGADYIGFDTEIYSESLAWVMQKGGEDHWPDETQRNTISSQVTTAIAAEGKVDYITPAGSNLQSGDAMYTRLAALGTVRMCQHTYYDQAYTASYDWDMYGAFVDTVKGETNPKYLISEIFAQDDWESSLGLWLWREGDNADELGAALAAYANEVPAQYCSINTSQTYNIFDKIKIQRYRIPV